MARTNHVLVNRVNDTPTTALDQRTGKPCERCVDVAIANGENTDNVYSAHYVELVNDYDLQVLLSGHYCDFCIDLMINNDMARLPQIDRVATIILNNWRYPNGNPRPGCEVMVVSKWGRDLMVTLTDAVRAGKCYATPYYAALYAHRMASSVYGYDLDLFDHDRLATEFAGRTIYPRGDDLDPFADLTTQEAT